MSDFNPIDLKAVEQAVIRPAALYHGSYRGIEGPLVPKRQSGSKNGEFPDGPKELVFATDNYPASVLYTTKAPQLIGLSDVELIAVGIDYEGWKKNMETAACTVYVLPVEPFTPLLSTRQHNYGTPTGEWLSEVSVMPVATRRYTPEEVMQETGGQIYFLAPEIDKKMYFGGVEKDEAGEDRKVEGFQQRSIRAVEAAGLTAEYTRGKLMTMLHEADLIEHHLNAETGIRPREFPEPGEALREALKDSIDWLKEQVAQARQAKIDATLTKGGRDVEGLSDLKTEVGQERRAEAQKDVSERE